MRYRGPIESYKMNKGSAEILADVKRLFSALDATSEDIETLKLLLHEGNTTIDGTDKTSRAILKLERDIRRFQGGLKYV
jgi:hypothetical protein